MTIEAALRWATTPSGTSRSWHAQRLGVVRGFARHLQAIGDCCEVPPPELLAFPKGRAQPYLYSQAEIASLMDAARALVPELRAATYETVIGLLATTGMRGGEAIRLDRSDVDLGGGTVTVVSSKSGRTRLLPLHPSTAGALDAYASPAGPALPPAARPLELLPRRHGRPARPPKLRSDLRPARARRRRRQPARFWPGRAAPARPQTQLRGRDARPMAPIRCRCPGTPAIVVDLSRPREPGIDLLVLLRFPGYSDTRSLARVTGLWPGMTWSRDCRLSG